jgi:predicted RND superfamily exporter protein
MLYRAARIILRYRIITLIVLVTLTGVMVFFTSKVKLSYEAARILPPKDSTYHQYLKFKEKFGEDGTVMVIGFPEPFTLFATTVYINLNSNLCCLRDLKHKRMPIPSVISFIGFLSTWDF